MFAVNYTTIHCTDPDPTAVRARIDSHGHAHVDLYAHPQQVALYGPPDAVEAVLRAALDRLAEVRQPAVSGDLQVSA